MTAVFPDKCIPFLVNAYHLRVPWKRILPRFWNSWFAFLCSATFPKASWMSWQIFYGAISWLTAITYLVLWEKFNGLSAFLDNTEDGKEMRDTDATFDVHKILILILLVFVVSCYMQITKGSSVAHPRETRGMPKCSRLNWEANHKHMALLNESMPLYGYSEKITGNAWG